jgi:hypothetical protein
MMSEQTEIIIHCWQPGPDTSDGCPTTCMMRDGHTGYHEWTRDDKITVKFAVDGKRDL